MPHALTAVPGTSDTIVVPDNGEGGDAADLEGIAQGLLNKVQYLLNGVRKLYQVDEASDLAAISGQANGDVALVLESLSLFVWVAGSTETAVSGFVYSDTGGRWIIDKYALFDLSAPSSPKLAYRGPNGIVSYTGTTFGDGVAYTLATDALVTNGELNLGTLLAGDLVSVELVLRIRFQTAGAANALVSLKHYTGSGTSVIQDDMPVGPHLTGVTQHFSATMRHSPGAGPCTLRVYVRLPVAAGGENVFVSAGSRLAAMVIRP